MNSPDRDEKILRTTGGDFPLDEYCFKFDGREWKILHVGAVLSQAEESHFLRELRETLPYGVTLWAAGIALAHEVAFRGGDEALREKRVLELGAGTGLPGIIAASMGAQVTQTDRNELAMTLCERNAKRNGAEEKIERRLVDWTEWNDGSGRYDYLLGSDILYAQDMHGHLRRIFENNLARGGRILLSDPFREPSIDFLESLEKDGWTIKMSKWSVGEESALRSIGVFELSPPAA